MAKRRGLYWAVSKISNIKSGEETLAILFFSYFFLITAPFTIIKSLRNSIMLHSLGERGLPPAYLLTAILTGFVVAFHSKLQDKISKRSLITWTLIFFIITSLIFWLLLQKPSDWVPLIYWLWANILAVGLMTHFWISVNEAFNPREAKRLIGFFGSGGILGGISGGLLAKSLSHFIDPSHLLLFSSALLFGCILIVNTIFVFGKKKHASLKAPESSVIQEKSEKWGFRVCFNTVKNNSYLRLIACLVTATLVVSTLIDFQFNSVINTYVEGTEKLTAFFGLFNAGLMAFALLIQLLITSNLIKRFGIQLALLLYPAMLLGCSMGIAIFPALLFAIVIKGTDKSLSYSLNQSVREILYIPISPDFKDKVKVFIDMFLNRFAKGLGAVILLILIYFRLGIQYVSLVSSIFIMAWIILNIKISREYVNTVKNNIKLKWSRADKDIADKIDMDYAKLIFDTLESKNRSSVLYALHVFDLIKQDRLTSEIKKLISQKSDEFKISSVEVLLDTDGASYHPEFEEEMDEETFKININEIMSLEAYEKLMKIYAENVMEKNSEAETDKMELAKAIGLMRPHSPLVEKLEVLINDSSSNVSKYAIESASRLGRKEFIPVVIQKLSNPATRKDAAMALKKFGTQALAPLEKYMGNRRNDMDARKAIPEVLAQIGTQKGADILVHELEKKKNELDTELIDALEKIRTEKPSIHISKNAVKKKTLLKIKQYCQSYIRVHELKPTTKNDFLRMNLKKESETTLMNIFKLLALFYPHEDITKAYQNIKTGTKNAIAYAVELLDNILKKDLRDIILPIIEDIPQREKEKKLRQILRSSP